jgi:hypothetical protein
MRRLGDAVRRFAQAAELPEDDLLLETVLADAELKGLMASWLGRGSPAAMAAFDRAATTQGEQRAAAIATVQALAREGRLFP